MPSGFGAITSLIAILCLVTGCSRHVDLPPGGLRPGDSVEAWEPLHVAGPHAGTKACPVCTYLDDPFLLAFARDEAAAKRLARPLEDLAASTVADDFHVLLCVLDCPEERLKILADAEGIQCIMLCCPDPERRDEQLAAYRINPAAESTLILYSDYKVREVWHDPANAELPGLGAAAQAWLTRPAAGPPPNPSESPSEPAVPQNTEASGSGAITPENTRIEFIGAAGSSAQPGHFARFEGSLEMPGDDPRQAKLRIAVEMDSVTTSVSLLTDHLKKADFFDVANHPRAELVSESVAPGPEPGEFLVTAQLDFRGVRKSLAFPATISVSPGEVAFTGTLTLRQSEFGMSEGARIAKDEVPVTITIRVPKS